MAAPSRISMSTSGDTGDVVPEYPIAMASMPVHGVDG